MTVFLPAMQYKVPGESQGQSLSSSAPKIHTENELLFTESLREDFLWIEKGRIGRGFLRMFWRRF